MPTVSETGPYLMMAVLCERAIREVDEVVSVIRVVDKITNTITGPSVRETLPAVPVTLTLVIMLRAGGASGPYTVKVGPEPPTGKPPEEQELPINFTGPPESGVNLIINFGMITSQEGFYWINVRLNDELLTRIPLQVEYKFTLQTGQAGDQEASPPE
jgi:hypothetical protein